MSFGNLPNFFLNFSEREMNGEEKHFYRFKSFRLDVKERQLLHHGDNIPLTPKVFDVLVALVERSGHLVEKDELLKLVWGDSFVEEVNIARSVHALRKVLGEDENGNKFIETVAKKGYRFVAKVTEMSEPPAVAGGFLPADYRTPLPTTDPPATAGGSDLAHTTAPSVVKPKQNTRIILFAVGFVSAVFLLVLLSFSFRSDSAMSPNKFKSIAILPVQPLTAENREPIYEFGIADSLILKLSSAKGLIVRPLSATRQYANIEQNAISAGREQKVDYVLASNYQIADGKIRITSQLINVQSSLVEEVFKVEQENSSIFSVLDAVAANVGGSLLKKLNQEPNNLSAKRYTTNEEAYRLYLQGAALADKRHNEDVLKAIEYFEQAVRLDPNYALAYARLANAQTALALNGGHDAREQYQKAKAAIEKALAIDDNLAEAHSYLGEIKSDFESDFAGAEREHRKAIALYPNSSIAHRMYALLLTYLGRHDESLAESKTAIDLEPASVLNHLGFGRSLLFARRYDEAIAELERTSETDSDFFFAHLSLSVAYRFKGDHDRAFESFVKTQIIGGEKPDEINLWKTTYTKSGWQGILERQLEQAKVKEKNGKPNYNQLANFSSELGQREEAFAYLEKALVQRGTITMLKVHPRFDSLRDDPRFDELVRRIGLK